MEVAAGGSSLKACDPSRGDRGQRPMARAPVRSPLRLSLVEREEISRGLVIGLSLRASAAQLGRSPSTISREVRADGDEPCIGLIARSGVRCGWFTRPKPAKLAVNAVLREIVEAKLERRWSPQISGWLKLTCPDEPEMPMSHESIYLSLFVQSRGALRKELTGYLRTGRARRRLAGLSVNNGPGQLRGVHRPGRHLTQARPRRPAR
jgi:IS30 family transposase